MLFRSHLILAYFSRFISKPTFLILCLPKPVPLAFWTSLHSPFLLLRLLAAAGNSCPHLSDDNDQFGYRLLHQEQTPSNKQSFLSRLSRLSLPMASSFHYFNLTHLCLFSPAQVVNSSRRQFLPLRPVSHNNQPTVRFYMFSL